VGGLRNLRLWVFAAFCSLTAWPVLAADTAPLSIAVMLSSDKNRCYDPGVVKAMRALTAREAGRINAGGGLAGRKLDLKFFDDFEVGEATAANLKTALADPQLVAVVGLSSSSRARMALTDAATTLRDAKVPVLSEISLNAMFAEQPTVYSMSSTVDTELQVIKRFARDRAIAKAAFIGLAADDYAMALGDGLARAPDAVPLLADHRISQQGAALDEKALAAAIADIAQKTPDMLFLAVQSGPGAQVLKALASAHVDVPVFVLYGRARRILDILAPIDPAKDVFELGRDGVPDVYNERLQQQIWRSDGKGWIFEDTPNKDTKGWADGSCTLTKTAGPPQILDDRNRRAIARGAQYADMIALVGDALATARAESDVPALRARIAERLEELSTGRSTLQGLWQNWWFMKNHTSGDDSLIVMRSHGQKSLVLAPVQYHRLGDTLQPTPVVYLSLDPIRLARIDSNDASFEAEFYLSLRSANAAVGIDTVEFTNAARSSSNADRLVKWHEIHDGAAGSSFPTGVRVYKVSGKFNFAPELGDFPFDSQRLSVSFQPVSTARPFLIQPSPKTRPMGALVVDGFGLEQSYVGSDQDFIPTIDLSTGGQQVVSFYKFNQTWVVKREAVDFYLRVLMPLAFILLVTWFSVFLSRERFESMMGIQVTALLSAIALYLALPNIASNVPTLYDKVFMLTYAAVSAMIGLTVLNDRLLSPSYGVLRRSLTALQTVVFPLAVVGSAAALLGLLKLP
jgi:hypothetical protein